MQTKATNKIWFLFILFSLSIFFSLNNNNNTLNITLNKNYISCNYYLNFSFSQTFIDLLYFNNQAEVNYSILLIKKVSNAFLLQEQKISEKKYQYFISYKNEKKTFTFFSSSEYFEVDSVDKLLNLINNIRFNNVFELKKTGLYFCNSTVIINSLAPISPALFFLFLFYNPYNLKLTNIISNVVSYEIPK